MAKNYSGLVRRNHTFYIRIRLPKSLFIFVKKQEICYSLSINDYREAIKKYKKESLVVKLFIKRLQEFFMEVSNGTVTLNETEQKQALLTRLEEVNNFVTNDYNEIITGDKSYKDISLLTKTDNQAIPSTLFDNNETLAKEFLKKFIISLGENKETSTSIKKISNQVKSGKLTVGFATETTNNDKQAKLFQNKLERVEIHGKNYIQSIVDNKPYNTLDPLIIELLETIKAKRVETLSAPIQTKTPWEEIFNQHIQLKNNRKACRESTNSSYHLAIQALFELINKEYIEDITASDISFVNINIYRMPKKWNLIEPQKILRDKLVPENEKNPKNKQSNLSIHKYLGHIKQFLKFAKRQRYIPDSFDELFDMPDKKITQEHTAFADEDLKKIFDKSIYPNPKLNKNLAKYWVTLIALYTGARQGEIVQLYIDDIKKDKEGFWYMEITDEKPKQHLKTPQSKRQVPLHPMLIELGLINYIRFLQNHKETLLFPTLARNNKFSKAIVNWFGVYVRNKAGITDKSKVFHSFRHTMASKLNEANIPGINIHYIGGWKKDKLGICETTYTHPKLKTLYNNICKVQFPVINEIFGIPLEKTMGNIK